MTHVSRRFTRPMDGREVEITLSTEALAMGDDLAVASSDVAGLIGLVGELIGVYTERAAVQDAEYRNWRAVATRAGDAEGKTAEFRLKAVVESDPRFLDFKRDAARLEGDLEFLRAYHDALRVKASIIRARADLLRQTFDGTAVGIGEAAPVREPLPPGPGTAPGGRVAARPAESDREDRIRGAFRRTRPAD